MKRLIGLICIMSMLLVGAYALGQSFQFECPKWAVVAWPPETIIINLSPTENLMISKGDINPLSYGHMWITLKDYNKLEASLKEKNGT